MTGIVVDNDIGGEFEILFGYLTSDIWLEAWRHLKLEVLSFEDVDLDRQASDRSIWLTCQQRQLVLITANRNKAGRDSLEATIQELTNPDSLPVFTLANPQRIMKDRPYARRVAEKLLEKLFDIKDYHGTGRIYLP